jgi:hypothetical protein
MAMKIGDHPHTGDKFNYKSFCGYDAYIIRAVTKYGMRVGRMYSNDTHSALISYDTRLYRWDSRPSFWGDYGCLRPV